jgi:DNA-binding LacI/PurR family transcriptional regulator
MRKPVLRDRVSRYLLHKLAGGDWPEGSPLPSLRTVSQQLRVSIHPVYRTWQWAEEQALVQRRSRAEALVAPGATSRAQALLADLARKQTAKRLAILLPPGYAIPVDAALAPFQARLVKAVETAAADRGYQTKLLNLSVRDQFAESDQLLHSFDAAFVVELSPAFLVTVARLADGKLPLVVYNRKVPGLTLPSVTTDDYAAGRRLAEQLVQLGHRNMTMITSSGRYDAIMDDKTRAERGWIDALTELDVLEHCIMPLVAEFDRELLLGRLLQLHPRITAVVSTAPGNEALLSRDRRFSHIRVPRDLSIALTSSSASLSLPPDFPRVTSFEVDWSRAGACTMELLDQTMAGNAAAKNIRVPLHMNLTDSIGAPPRA